MTTQRFIVRRTTEADWRRLRDLRLALVADEPLAYHETLERARHTPEHEWRRRAARGSGVSSITLAAIATDGHWLGTMAATLPRDSATANLLAVYVRPPFRGRENGVTDALLRYVEMWAARRASSISLEVHETNARARRAYAHRGYVETGVAHPHPLDPRLNEIEMTKRLPPLATLMGRTPPVHTKWTFEVTAGDGAADGATDGAPYGVGHSSLMASR